MMVFATSKKSYVTAYFASLQRRTPLVASCGIFHWLVASSAQEVSLVRAREREASRACAANWSLVKSSIIAVIAFIPSALYRLLCGIRYKREV